MSYMPMNYKVKQLYSTNIISNKSNNFSQSSRWHNSFELLLCYSGNATVKIGSKSHNLTKNRILFINSLKSHSIKSKVPFQLLRLTIEKECLCEYKDIFSTYEFDTKLSDKNYISLVKLRNYMEELNIIQERNQGLELNFRIKACINDIIFLLLTEFKVGDFDTQMINTSQKYEEILSKIMIYIEENYHYPITLAETAKLFSYSSTYFSKFFKKHSGISFSEYLTKVRLKHAYFDLTMTDLSINKIAFKNGFSNSRSFSSYFKKQYGYNPKKYRLEIH